MAFIDLWLAGALLSVVGSTFSNLGVNIQKFSAMKEADRDPQRGYWCQPTWVLGFCFVVFGSLFDFAALAFAAQSIVATVGSMTLVANIFFAHFWLGEALGKRDLVGTGLIIGGAVVAVLFGNRKESDVSLEELKTNYTRFPFILYIIVVGGIMVFAYGTVRAAEPILEQIMICKREHAALDTPKSPKGRGKKAMSIIQEDEHEALGSTTDLQVNLEDTVQDGSDDSGSGGNPPLSSFNQRDLDITIDELMAKYEKYERIHPPAYCALAGFFGSLVLIFAKSTAELIRFTTEGDNQFVLPLTYAFIAGMFICIFAETHFLAKGLKYFDALYVVPVFQCFFITQGASAGGVFFGEFASFSLKSALLFPTGVIITLIGVYILSSRDMSDVRDDVSEDDEMNELPKDDQHPDYRAKFKRRESKLGFMIGERSFNGMRLSTRDIMTRATRNLPPTSAGSILFAQLQDIHPLINTEHLDRVAQYHRRFRKRRSMSALPSDIGSWAKRKSGGNQFRPKSEDIGNRLHNTQSAPNLADSRFQVELNALRAESKKNHRSDTEPSVPALAQLAVGTGH